MATTTPNYAWVVPTSSDLVKNGATAIETLGDSADASLWNSGYGQAGKNKIINGDFTINQRGFTSVTTDVTYNFDRWRTRFSGGTSTTTPQTFTLGAAPVAGYEGKNFYRVAITGQAAVTDFVRVEQAIESVRTFAGQTATFSFWAKAATGTPKIAIIGVQSFASGSGGSAAVTTEYGTVTISTSWARYSVVCAIPSISGKTIGTAGDDFLSIRLLLSAGTSVTGNQSIGYQNTTFDIWGVQAEYGSYATPFQTASGGSYQDELAMCQRYLPAVIADGSIADLGSGFAYSTTQAYVYIPFKVTPRVKPTGITVSAVGDFGVRNISASILTSTNVAINTAGTDGSALIVTVASGLVAGNGTTFIKGTTGSILFTGCEY
jgi:hypothetical protein